MQRQVSDVADSTDWIVTSLPSFSALESALRCQVCKDFYDTPMITTCSHTFCSLCIRRCLSNDGKCPTCRAGDQATKLRRNWAIQEVVDAFKGARQSALQLATQDAQSKCASAQDRRKGRKRKREVIEDPTASQGRQTRRSTRQADKERQAAVIAVDSDSDDGSYKSERESFVEEEVAEDGLVACPMCGARMKEELVFGHLDKCTGDAPPRQDKSKAVPSSRSAHFPQTPQSPRRTSTTPPTPSRLPQLNYSLLKDNALKKKLSELGLPNWGPRQLLIRRHTEWVDIYNSNSDSVHPRPIKALLHDLTVWEKSQGGSAPNNAYLNTAPQHNSIMAKDFDTDDWKGKHKDQFGDLIAQARAKAKEQKEKAEKEAMTAKPDHVDDHSSNAERSERRPSPMEVDDIAPASGQGENLQADGTPQAATAAPKGSQGSQGQTSGGTSSSRKLSADDRRRLSQSAPAISLFTSAVDSDDTPNTESAEAKLNQMRENAARPSQSPERARKLPMFLVPQHSATDIDDAVEAAD